MIIAIDFDGTLCDFAYPSIGKPHYDVIAKVKMAFGLGHTVILWTCRDEEHYLAEAVQWCRSHEIYFDEVNKQCDEFRCRFGDPRKINADIYVDDKASGSIEYFLNMKL